MNYLDMFNTLEEMLKKIEEYYDCTIVDSINKITLIRFHYWGTKFTQEFKSFNEAYAFFFRDDIVENKRQMYYSDYALSA